jgi:lipid-binding SYLF domain-containing protein
MLSFTPMKTTTLLVVTLAWLGPAAACQALDQKKLRDDVQIAVESFQAADSGLKKLFTNAAGYVVFPNVGKGGFVFGGAHGNGLAFEKGKLIGQASLSQITVGAQIGGQEFAEVIFFETTNALGRFKESNLQMSVQVSAVAAAEGVSANAKYVEGVLVFTRVKQGLMAEASVGGQKFTFKPLSDTPATPPPKK